MNVMLISVALWSGAADASGWATRDFFHWLSALVVLPSVAYAGRPFFDSAMKALRQFSFNMDVPITIGVTLALVDVGRADVAARARRLFRQRDHAGAVPARRPLSRPADAPAHPRRRLQSRGDQGGDRDQAARRRRGARDADRRDLGRRSGAGARRRPHRRRRIGRGGAFRDRPEPGDRRNGGDCRRAGGDGLRRHAQPRRRAAHPRQQGRRRHAARRGQSAARARDRAAFVLRAARRSRFAPLHAGRAPDRARRRSSAGSCSACRGSRRW